MTNSYKKESPLAGFSGFGGGAQGLPAAGVAVVGQAAFITDGTETDDRHYWVCPDGVTSISIVCIGAGGWGGGANGKDGGGGGGLGYKNNYSVTPGTTYHIYCGKGDTTAQGFNNQFVKDSWFSTATGSGTNSATSDAAPVRGRGALANSKTGGGYTGDGGGTGGNGGDETGSGGSTKKAAGGAGAGGYAGNGGDGAAASGSWPDYFTGSAGATDSGAGGGGGSVGYYSNSGKEGYGGGGGGVGLLGKGSTGAGGAGAGGVYNPGSGITATRGGNGSGGSYPQSDHEYGGNYGGGAGGSTAGSQMTTRPGRGAVRLIWPGDAREFPSTRTADE